VTLPLAWLPEADADLKRRIGMKVVGHLKIARLSARWVLPAQGLGCHSARASRRILALLFDPQKVALIESMNPQWQDLSEE
jgi:hypothetical protein